MVATLYENLDIVDYLIRKRTNLNLKDVFFEIIFIIFSRKVILHYI